MNSASWGSDERFTSPKEMTACPRRLAERLQKPVNFERAWNHRHDGSGFRLALRDAQTTEEKPISSCSLFLHIFATRSAIEMPDGKIEAIRELGYGTNAN